jgi:hypothetical protein
MKLSGAGTEDRNKLIAVGAFVVIAAAILYFGYFADSSPTAPAAAPAAVVSAPADSAGAGAGPAAKSVGTTSAALDPTLHMEAMLASESVVYAGSGRNIFSAASAPPPVVIPKPVAQARNTAPVVPVQGRRRLRPDRPRHRRST